jgi:tetratricopeptide (TPR) repeat protein
LYSNTQKELYSLQSNQIWANNNWWGTTSPGSNEIYGNVDYDPWLASDPNGSPSNLNVLIARAESDKQPNLFNFGSKGTPNDYNSGYFLELAGEYRKAIAAYQSVVENNPSSSAAMLSLVGIKRCYEYLEQYTDGISYFQNSVAAHKSTNIATKAQELVAPFYVRAGQIEKALNCYETLLGLTDVESVKKSLFEMWQIHFNITGNSSKALELMNQYAKKYSLDDNLLFMKVAMGKMSLENIPDINTKQITTDESEQFAENDIPNVYELGNNYPNPFNPITTIQYQLPEETTVSLIIYNMNGQIINKLVNHQVQQAGTYQAQWNATDMAGNAVSSGMYFYKLICNDFVDVKKMLLLR